MPLPAWLATTVHFPALSRVMVAPLAPPAVHTAGVVVVKVTTKPDEALALTVNGDCAIFLFASSPKVMFCEAMVTVKLWLTAEAGL